MEKAILKGKKSIESHEPEMERKEVLEAKKVGWVCHILLKIKASSTFQKKNFVTGTITNEDIEDNRTRVPSCQSHFLNNENVEASALLFN